MMTGRTVVDVPYMVGRKYQQDGCGVVVRKKWSEGQ